MTTLRFIQQNPLRRAVLLAALAATSALVAPARADEPSPQAAAPIFTEPTVHLSLGAPPRLADVAPSFALRDVNGKLWSSLDALGQRSLSLVLVSEPAVDAVGLETLAEANERRAKNAAWLSQGVRAAANALKNRKVDVVVVAAGDEFIRLLSALGGSEEIAKHANLFLLRDVDSPAKMRGLRELFGRSASGVALAAIDRAGFLRRSEGADDVQAVGTVLRLWGDPTPALEVGKPAPDFAITDMLGRVRRLSDMQGQRNLLLSFFPKCFTGG
jgi:hypothetical protein